MDQIIITNGFVDERGHYLVNGNSYEIYDPYTNTVTVVVGPPPYTSGVSIKQISSLTNLWLNIGKSVMRYCGQYNDATVSVS